jgi:hypothetical protein
MYILDQNLIVVYQKFNDDFKRHISFGWAQKRYESDMYHYSTNTHLCERIINDTCHFISLLCPVKIDIIFKIVIGLNDNFKKLHQFWMETRGTWINMYQYSVRKLHLPLMLRYFYNCTVKV